MPTGETGKQRVSWIDREYFRRPDQFRRWKLILSVVALLAGLAWCAWGAFTPASHHAPGPVAAVHAMWEQQCSACHVAFSPIRGDSWLSSAETARNVDAKCIACHRGEPHHHNQKMEEVGSCASCHIEHRGRHASLVRLDDHQCMRCHVDLKAHVAKLEVADGNALPQALAISHFDAEHHPEFRNALHDPGHLKFSHARHMASGLNLGKGDRFPARRWQDIPEDRRSRYLPAGTSSDDLVQLDCAACHQLETHRASAASTGDCMLPVAYERHCAACHPLPFEPDPIAKKDATSARETFSDGPFVPHGLSGAQLRTFLEKTYAELYLKDHPEVLRRRTIKSALPKAQDRDELKSAGEVLQDKIQRAKTNVQGRCQECHEVRDIEFAGGVWFDVVETKVPPVWLTNARFDHAAHRALDCRECHRIPPLDAAATSLDNAAVLIPQREVCLNCHAPKRADGTGGARHDCLECHRYHDLEHSSRNISSPTRHDEFDHKLQEFIRGEAAEQK